MTGNELNFVKLNDTNYTVWKFSVKITLESANPMAYINETEDEQDEVGKNYLKKWKYLSKKSINFIVGSVEMRLQRCLINSITPEEAWIMLKQRFGGISEDETYLEKFTTFTLCTI